MWVHQSSRQVSRVDQAPAAQLREHQGAPDEVISCSVTPGPSLPTAISNHPSSHCRPIGHWAGSPRPELQVGISEASLPLCSSIFSRAYLPLYPSISLLSSTSPVQTNISLPKYTATYKTHDNHNTIIMSAETYALPKLPYAYNVSLAQQPPFTITSRTI